MEKRPQKLGRREKNREKDREIRNLTARSSPLQLVVKFYPVVILVVFGFSVSSILHFLVVSFYMSSENKDDETQNTCLIHFRGGPQGGCVVMKKGGVIVFIMVCRRGGRKNFTETIIGVGGGAPKNETEKLEIIIAPHLEKL